MTRVAVDLERLTHLVDRMAAFERHLVRTHDAVSTRADELHASWTGDAAAAQAVAQHQWSVSLGDVHAALAELRRAGQIAHANYAAAIVANRRMWAQ